MAAQPVNRPPPAASTACGVASNASSRLPCAVVSPIVRSRASSVFRSGAVWSSDSRTASSAYPAPAATAVR